MTGGNLRTNEAEPHDPASSYCATPLYKTDPGGSLKSLP